MDERIDLNKFNALQKVMVMMVSELYNLNKSFSLLLLRPRRFETELGPILAHSAVLDGFRRQSTSLGDAWTPAHAAAP